MPCNESRRSFTRAFGAPEPDLSFLSFGKSLYLNQAIQYPLVELHTEAAMLRLLIRSTAAAMDKMSKPDVAKRLSDKVAMCNYRANRLCCNAADQAIQTHGGIGYSRHKQFGRRPELFRHCIGTDLLALQSTSIGIIDGIGLLKAAMRSKCEGLDSI